MVSSGILRFSLAKRSCLTYLQPIRIRAANAFAVFLVWPARRRVLQRAVCHLAAGIDNNIEQRLQLNAEKSRMLIRITNSRKKQGHDVQICVSWEQCLLAAA